MPCLHAREKIIKSPWKFMEKKNNEHLERVLLPIDGFIQETKGEIQNVVAYRR